MFRHVTGSLPRWQWGHDLCSSRVQCIHEYTLQSRVMRFPPTDLVNWYDGPVMGSQIYNLRRVRLYTHLLHTLTCLLPAQLYLSPLLVLVPPDLLSLVFFSVMVYTLASSSARLHWRAGHKEAPWIYTRRVDCKLWEMRGSWRSL